MGNNEICLIEDEEKVTLLRDIMFFMTSEPVGELSKFAGRIEGKDMIVSFDVGDMCPSLDISRNSFPLSGGSALLSDILNQVQKFTIIPHSKYVTVEFTIGDYLVEETLDF